MSQVAAFWGVVRYEFLMQARRPALWIGMLLLSAFLFRNFHGFYLTQNLPTVSQSLGNWASFVANFFPIAAGLLLADRYTRDRGTRVDELLTTSPSSSGARLFGKFLGSSLATALPVLLVYLFGTVLILAYWRDPGALPEALAIFCAVNLVGILFVGAFSVACTTALWVPLYMFLFVGYWFWGNFLNPHLGIPTLNGTLLTPGGAFIEAGLFPDTVLRLATFHARTATVSQGVESLALLLGCALLALLAAWTWLGWQQRHR
jgi:ABC-type transport system involved in multi-copper enzyme maturation permease subunit